MHEPLYYIIQYIKYTIVIRISLVALNIFNVSKTKHLYELKLNKIISYNFTVELSNKQSAFSETYFQVLSASNNRTTNANKAFASPDLYAIFLDVGGSIFHESTGIILLCVSAIFSEIIMPRLMGYLIKIPFGNVFSNRLNRLLVEVQYGVFSI